MCVCVSVCGWEFTAQRTCPNRIPREWGGGVVSMPSNRRGIDHPAQGERKHPSHTSDECDPRGLTFTEVEAFSKTMIYFMLCVHFSSVSLLCISSLQTSTHTDTQTDRHTKMFSS